MKNYYGTEFYYNVIYHHGIKGQKWGVRRFQNPDGSLTAAGQRRIQKLEKKAIKKEYKRYRKAGGHFLFKSARESTGKNYNEAVENFNNVVKNDKVYKDLSEKAFEAEKKRLLLEKSAYDKKTGTLDDAKYEKIINSEEYNRLYKESINAKRAKDRRLNKIEKDYVDTIKDAKLKDLNIEKNKEEAKKYISSFWQNQYSDDNLDFNVDNFYDEWVDKEKFK